MADIKTNQERDELFRRIYKIATDLVHAGHVSEWDFKSYVLGTMFYRYISENFAVYVNEGEHAAGNQDFDYAKMSDEDAEPAREGLVQEKGFFILPSELFCNVRARADQDENLNETLERVFAHIESSAASGDAENDFAGLFDDFDVNSKSIGETVAKRNKVLAELLDGVAQEGWPVFHSGGCLRVAGPAGHHRKNKGQQGLRPRLRFRFAAAEGGKGAGQGQHRAGLFRAGDRPDHLQPLPHQYVPAQHRV